MHRPLVPVTILSTLLLLSLSLFAGCGGGGDEKAAEKVAETIMEKAGGGKADVDIEDGKISVKGEGFSMEASETDEWPKDMPGSVPEFTYGKLTAVTDIKSPDHEGRKIDVHFQEIESGAFEKYQKDLEKAGWRIHRASKNESGGMLMAEKGEELHLVFGWDNEERTGTVMFMTE